MFMKQLKHIGFKGPLLFMFGPGLLRNSNPLNLSNLNAFTLFFNNTKSLFFLCKESGLKEKFLQLFLFVFL